MKKKDYRKSHLKKGEAYHSEFSDNAYKATMWELEQEIINNFLNKYFNKKPIDDYLDFACGTGRIIQHLESYTINSVGIDISESMLNIARKNCSKSDFIVAGITNENILINKKFDLITAFRFFPNAEEHLRKQIADLLSNHIKTDGFFVFNNHRNRSSFLFKLIQMKRFRKVKLGMSEDEIISFLQDTGIKIIKKYHIGFLPVKDSTHVFRKWHLKAIEKRFMKLSSKTICNLSQNIIYICQKI